MNKRLFAAVLAVALVMGLGACGSSDKDKEPSGGLDSDFEQDVDANGDIITGGGVTGGVTGGGVDAPEAEGTTPGGTKPGDTKPPTGKPEAPKPGAGKPSGGGSTTGGATSKPAISGTFEEILSAIYTAVKYDGKTANTEVTAENAEYYLGTTDIAFKKALASEPMMSSVAHSIVLLEAESGADIKAIKKKIKENVDGRKWVCVGVEPENILVENVGNYILLVMDEEAQSFMDAFLAMGK